MRFTVATAVLARSFLHAAAFTEDEQQFANKVSHAGEREKMQILLEKKPSPLGPGQQQRAMQHQRKVAALKRKAQERVKPLTNLRQAKKEFTECDPNALDLGVLACGSDEFCMENQSSSKGGFCSSRPLEYYDDDDYDDDYDDAFDDGIGFDDDYDDGFDDDYDDFFDDDYDPCEHTDFDVNCHYEETEYGYVEVCYYYDYCNEGCIYDGVFTQIWETSRSSDYGSTISRGEEKIASVSSIGPSLG